MGNQVQKKKAPKKSRTSMFKWRKKDEKIQKEKTFEKKPEETDEDYLARWELLNKDRRKTSDTINFDTDLLIAENKNSPLAQYEILSSLGQGSYGTVFLVKHKVSKQIRAMKMIKKVTENGKTTDEEIFNEINILKKIDHPSIIKIFEFYIGKNDYALVTEYCSGGQLYDIMGGDKKYTEAQIGYIMYQILSAVNYCHKMDIVHRDLKPENILVKKIENNDIYRVSICDFGTSQIFTNKENVSQDMAFGTPYYMAPEVFQSKCCLKSDIWSCGVILYLFLCSRYPFMGKNISELSYNILNQSYDSNLIANYSSSCLDLVAKMLEKDPEKRITAEEAINHKFFVENKSKEILNNFTDDKILKEFFNNLKKYSCKSILQETAIAYLVHNYPDLNGVVEAGKLFSKIDVNGNGTVSFEEFYKFLSGIIKDIDKDDVAEMFNNIDTDQDRIVNYEDFIRAAIDKSIFLDDNVLRFAFDFFDKDESGEITIDEIAEIFKDHVKQDDISNGLKQIIAEVDLDKDGKIQFNEFQQVMKNLLE